MAMTTHGFDMYLRFTDAQGKSVVREHRVWDKERFLKARQGDAAKENAKEKSTKKAKAEHITREQYLQERSK